MVFSGSGRHRRPTQADRAVVAAGVAGAGLALPLLTATGAHAAPVSTWDAVAQCASGSDWSQESGGGYGGLQISLRDWVGYGGDQYAAEPDHATKQQQIAVAESILADQGPSAWATCAAAGGLTGPSPAAPPASTPAPAPSSPATANPTANPTASPTAGPTTAQPSAPAAPIPALATTAPAAPSPSATATPSTPVPSTATPASPSATVPGTPAPTAAPAAPSTPAAPAPPAVDPGTASPYTVVPGDTLSGISDAHQLGGWQHLYEANQAIIGGDPNLIRPGQVLHLL